MAKKNMVERELKRIALVAKYAEKRKGLVAITRNPNASYQEKVEAQEKLQKLPRDSSAIRVRNRCSETGRPHGFFRRFGLGRNKLRENAMWGNIPGIVKSSW